MKKEFKKELRDIVNRLCIDSIDSKVGAPDFILTDFLVDCMTAFEKAVKRAGEWEGKPSEPSSVEICPYYNLPEGGHSYCALEKKIDCYIAGTSDRWKTCELYIRQIKPKKENSLVRYFEQNVGYTTPGWYFTVETEYLQGPYKTRGEATAKLCEYGKQLIEREET